LDITVTEELKNEGIAREFINRIQNIRKDSGFEVTDKIRIQILNNEAITNAINTHSEYIATQTLAQHIELVDNLEQNHATTVELDDIVTTLIRVDKI
jgi:isoleucyl-tRNA synthetase